MTPTVELRDKLRQMIAALQNERQALAGLDLDAILGLANEKQALCDSLEDVDRAAVDEECRGLLEAARRLNEVNRQIRNLIAANVSTRLDMLTGSPIFHRSQAAYAYAVARG